MVEELRNPGPRGQPLIEIRQMGRGGVKHVRVIWDEWDGCAPETRAEIIRDAFTEAKGEAFEKSIMITVAATVPEAAEIGLLPFEVKPARSHKLDPEKQAAAKATLLAEGASVLGQPALPALRFANETEAEEALARLKERLPDLDWCVVVTHPSPD